MGITVKTTDDERALVINAAKNVMAALCEAGVKAELNMRDNVTPGLS